MEFEWDPEKDRENQKKHGVKLSIAVEVFLDPHRIEEIDDRDDYGEERLTIIGMAQLDLLFVVATKRAENLMRLISARHATPQEADQYSRSRREW